MKLMPGIFVLMFVKGLVDFVRAMLSFGKPQRSRWLGPPWKVDHDDALGFDHQPGLLFLVDGPLLVSAALARRPQQRAEGAAENGRAADANKVAAGDTSNT